MRIQTKICGLSTPDSLGAAIAGGASHVGFVFFAPSPRDIAFDQAAALAANIPPHVKPVGVFVDPDDALLDKAARSGRLAAIQLHGSETPERAAAIKAHYRVEIWKAIPVRRRADLAAANAWRGVADRILYDAKTSATDPLPGGMGVRFDWRLLDGHVHRLPWGLSGGLDATNIAEAIDITGAPLVDVSSGVESAPGVKDASKIAAFLKAVAKL